MKINGKPLGWAIVCIIFLIFMIFYSVSNLTWWGILIDVFIVLYLIFQIEKNMGKAFANE